MTTFARRLVAIVTVATIALVSVWYVALWSPQQAHLHRARQARATAEQQVQKLDARVVDLRTQIQGLPRDRAKLATYEAELPDSPAFADALDQLQHTASTTGVEISSVEPSTPPGSASATAAAAAQTGAASNSGPPSITLAIEAAGSQAQMESFLTQLASLSQTSRLFVVDKLEYSGIAPVSVSLGVQIFYAGQPTP